MSASRFIGTQETMLPIEIAAISAGAMLAADGITDDSVALKAVHDWAYANGIRELYCSKRYYAPSAFNLGNVIFRGPGSLIGTYRKKVIPFSARAFASQAPRIIPAAHLKNFSRAVSPTVVIWGDSTGTEGPGAAPNNMANHISASEMLWSILYRSFLRSNPGKTINRVNLSISATKITDYGNTGTALVAEGVTLPSWFTPSSSTWTSFVTAAAPDLVIINFGANSDGGGTTPAAVQALVTFLLALPKVPDILFCTNLPRSVMADIGSGGVATIEDREWAAGSIRSYAEFYGYGLLDLHRIGCMMRDGFDPCTQVITNAVSNQSYSLPATLPQTGGDFELIFQIDNTGGAAFGSSQQLAVALSPLPGCELSILQAGGNYRWIGYSGSGNTWQPAVTTSVAMPTGICTIEVSLRDNFITIYFENTLVYAGLHTRAAGCQFQPQISYLSGSGAASVTVVQYSPSAPAPVQPALTDAEMFGASPFPNGGNGINHPSSLALEAIHAAVIDAIDLNAPLSPIQSIVAAGAVNADCNLVKITGPATGTYAITLAAPRVQDKGKMLALHMIATTGTNAVTLALTNVTGGTAPSSCSWSAAGQKLILMACDDKWEVIKQDGVTLS